MGATPWVELNMAGSTGWTEGFPDYSMDSSTDYFIDFLFETTNFFAQMPTTHTELSMGSATASTELTAPAVSWTELTG